MDQQIFNMKEVMQTVRRINFKEFEDKCIDMTKEQIEYFKVMLYMNSEINGYYYICDNFCPFTNFRVGYNDKVEKELCGLYFDHNSIERVYVNNDKYYLVLLDAEDRYRFKERERNDAVFELSMELFWTYRVGGDRYGYDCGIVDGTPSYDEFINSDEVWENHGYCGSNGTESSIGEERRIEVNVNFIAHLIMTENNTLDEILKENPDISVEDAKTMFEWKYDVFKDEDERFSFELFYKYKKGEYNV